MFNVLVRRFLSTSPTLLTLMLNEIDVNIGKLCEV